MKSFILMVITMVCAISLEAQNKSFYDFNVTTIDGKEFPLSSLKGKKVLVVNVASKCGLTPQYAKLQELYDKYKDKNFVIIGFPANNFMGQEPGSNEEIAQFCSLNFMIDENGSWVGFVAPKESPFSEKIVTWIEEE